MALMYAALVLLASCQDALSPTGTRSRDPLFSEGLTLTASKQEMRLIIGDTTSVSVVANALRLRRFRPAQDVKAYRALIASPAPKPTAAKNAANVIE